MIPLAAHAQIVRIYADAIRASFGPILNEKQPSAELAKLLLGLAEATAGCAEAIVDSQRELETLARDMGLSPPPVTLRVIEGGQR